MANLLSTTVNGALSASGRISATYDTDRYQFNFYRPSASNWWVTNDSDKLGIHLNNVGDRFYFGTGGDFWSSANGWLSTALAGKLSTGGTAANSSQLEGFSAYALVTEARGVHSGSDFVNGTLVTTDINANSWAGNSFVMEVSGKSYGSGTPFKLVMEGYLYADTIINVSAMSYGYYFPSPVKVMRYNGNIAFWWPRGSYWNSFQVHVRNADGDSWNRVTGITDSVDPASADKKISITPTQVIHTGNIGSQSVSYATTAGSITGQANSATINASTGVNANDIVRRDGNGYIYANHINFSTTESENPTISSFITSNGDGWSRKSSLAHVRNQLGNYGNWITTDGRAYPRRSDGTAINFWWDGQGGQPTWLWGSNNGVDFYVWNPSNFSVNYATTAGSAPANGGTSTHTYRGIIEDTRSGQRTPNAYDDYRVSWEFTNQMPHDGNWLSVMTMQGWSDGYAAWQIMGTATTTAFENWYLRSGVNGTWNPARTIIHSGNIGSQSVNYASSAGSATTATNLGADYTADDWIRATADNNPVKFYGNSYQITWRTDGASEAYSGIGAYPFVWTYGGSSASNRRMLMDTSGNLWTNTYGWLHDYFQIASTAITTSNIASQSVSYADESGFASSAGSVEWTSVQNKPATFPPSSHNHDDRYFTESESDGRFFFAQSSQLANTNLNDLTTRGVYYSADQYGTNSNIPYANYFTMINLTNDVGRQAQLWFGDTPGRAYWRPRQGDATWHPWEQLITSNNIGSQSVNYATSAGNADTVDGYHESAFWRDGQDRRIGALRFSGEGGNSGNGVIAYGIFQEGGDWTHPYPDLRIAFHTGIKLGANAGYEGIRFYTDYDMSSQVMSVNNGSDPLGQGNVYVNNSLQAGSSLRAPIFYDSNDTTYYGDFASTSYLRHLSVGDVNASNDGSWNARLNLTGSSHARLDVKSNSDGIITTMFSHTGQGVGRVGTMSNHPLAFMVNGSVAGYAYANYLQGVDSVRAPIFYDSNDTGYYLDPNGTSNLLQLTTATRARWNMPRVWYDRSSRTSDQGYWTGTNGWGAEDGTWANAWKGGFSGWDIWGSNTDHPQGAGSIHAQGIVSGIHYSSSDGSAAYGWMMVGANGAVANRYWLRGKWDTTTSSWVEMITTGNIASQSVSYADESGYSASAGSVEWTSVQNKPATFSPSSHTHAISDVTGLQTALDGKQASGSYAAASHTHAIADVTGLQAALDGKQAAGSYAAASHTHTFASLTSKPTTISGYGITDAITTGNIGSQSVSSASGVSITGFGTDSFTYHQTPGNVHGWTGGWASHFIGNHGNGDTYYSQSIIMPFWGVPRYQRNEGGNKVGPWQFITEENIATQSVSFATTSGSATSSTTANRLDNYGINYGSDWNTWGVYGKLVASSYHNASGANKPPTYTYGSFLSFLNSGADSFQIAIPENQWNGTGKERAMHYRSAWNGTWSSWRQVVDIQNNVCDILADGTSTLIVRQGVGYNQPFSSNIEIHGSVDDWAYGKFRFRVQNESGTEPVYGAQFRIERFSVNTGWQLLGMVPRGSQNLEWQGDILPGLSDQRVKENVVSLTDGVATVQQINPVEFDWKPVENVSEREGHDIGFIAQQLEEIVPTAVHTRSDGYKTVKYEKVVPILVQAIKEQQSMIEQLSARLSALEQK